MTRAVTGRSYGSLSSTTFLRTETVRAAEGGEPVNALIYEVALYGGFWQYVNRSDLRAKSAIA